MPLRLITGVIHLVHRTAKKKVHFCGRKIASRRLLVFRQESRFQGFLLPTFPAAFWSTFPVKLFPSFGRAQSGRSITRTLVPYLSAIRDSAADLGGVPTN
jgi:hypothetical protein